MNTTIKNKLVSIIIPLFNQVHYTRKCLAALEKNTPQHLYELILVDNASTDSTPDLLEKLKGNVRIITNSANMGFSKANNQGAKSATGEYLVFLNNDTEVQDKWLENLIEILKTKNDVGIVGAKLFYPNGTIQHCGKVWTYNAQDGYRPIHIYLGKKLDYPPTNKDRYFQMVTGACMGVRRSEFIKIDGFDEEYQNGCEDDDICYKYSQIGKKIYYCSGSLIMHHENVSLNGNQNEINEIYNRKRFFEKWRKNILRDDFKYYCEDNYELSVDNEKLVFKEIAPRNDVNIKNVAILCLVRGGDVFLTTSILPEIRVKHKNAKITYLTSPKNKIILEGNSNVDSILPFGENEYNENSWYQAVYKCKEYDIVYKLQPIPELGNHFFTSLRDGSMHLLDIYSSKIGVYHRNNKPFLNINGEIKNKYNLLKKWGVNPDLKIITFNIISADLIKNWDVCKLRELLSFMDSLKSKYTFILLGGEESKDILIPNLINLAGKTTIKEAAMLVAESNIFVGVDSMLAHFTSINNTKSIFLFAPTSPYYCGPINDNCVYITNSYMNMIKPRNVFNCLVEMLKHILDLKGKLLLKNDEEVSDWIRSLKNKNLKESYISQSLQRITRKISFQKPNEKDNTNAVLEGIEMSI